MLFESLTRAGADEKTANKVINKVKPKLKEGITTKKIYTMAFKFLRAIDNPTASRYKIKWAMMRLGKREGFSFEQFLKRLFEKMGYKVKTNILLKGAHISHEIDLILEKGGKKIMVESKHRSKPATWVHVQVPLAVYARYLDLKKKFDEVYIITNTRFTKHGIDYAKGVDLSLIGWDFPKNDNSLRELIDKYKVYPITVLKSVNQTNKAILLKNEIITVTDIMDKKDIVKKNIPDSKRILEEAEIVMKTGRYS